MSRRQLYRCGVTRYEIRSNVRARRWQLVCDQVVALHNSEVSERGHRWAAVISAGPRAQLDGVASLVECGLERVSYDRIRVSVPKGARVRTRRTERYDVRETRRWSRDDREPGHGVPRTKPAVAAMRAAIWARTDREAAYLLSVVVQQGLVHPSDIALELLRIKRHRRRLFVHAVVNDLLDGARALGELDVARELKRRGIPRPARQVVRKDRKGRYYLDLYWPDSSWSSRSTASTTRGRRTSSVMRCVRTRWPSPVTRCSGCRCSTQARSGRVLRPDRRSDRVRPGRLGRLTARNVLRGGPPAAPSVGR